MNSIHTVLAGTLSSDLNIRNIVIQTLSEACVKCPSLESELLKLTELSLSVHIIEFISSNIKRYNVALEIQLPCKECALIWMPWLPHQTQPPRSPGNYNMPTWSFGASYTFTAQTLEQEPETPPEITALYQETKEIFDFKKAPMHPENADATRNLMSVLVPAGLYSLVMAKKLWYAFPDVVELTEKGASQTGLVQALWVKENKEIVKAAILDGKLNNRNTAKNKTERTDAELVQDFEEWCLERTSYTLRQFASSDVEVLIKTSRSLKRKYDE
ncbi:hypothetical protein BCR33DRAFT_715427, partial [Rhizoclosmatium globosum]